MRDCHEFGKMAAAEAQRRNLHAAPRRALLGDGSAWIWNQQEKWFRDWTPIVDFVHALTYLYVTATVLASSETLQRELAPGRHAWVQVARGNVSINGEALAEGDGAAVSGEQNLSFTGGPDGSEFLFFDLA